MKNYPGLVIVVLSLQLLTRSAAAMDGGAFVLTPGEVQTVSVGSTDRSIHVCNDLNSPGDLVVVFEAHEPVRLAPGFCKWGHGDHFTLRNESKSMVSCIYQVTGKHQS